MVLRCREQRARLVRVRNVVSLGLIAVLASGCLVGVGDPYFPTYGNGGYDVAHYDLAIRYDPGTDVLQGTASIDARATSALPIFDLDLMGLTVHGITVDGRPARWVHGAHELTVTPARPVHAHQKFRVVVAYSGVPVPTVNGGFIATHDGAAVSGQPEGAATWFPVNDHPIDKATYTFRVTVPDGLGVIANGLPAGAPSAATPGWTTHVWQTFTPMASYLATVDIGNWDVRQRRTTSGLPVIDAVDPKWAGPQVDASLAQEPEMIDFLSSQFGRYPVESAGAIVADLPLPFALETQTRPIYPGYFFLLPDRDLIVVHELAHQWYGDSVSVARWQDIWLNEGFATYAEWLWSEYRHQSTPQDTFVGNYESIAANDPFWSVKVGDPGPADLFDDAVYVRGAMTLQAFRDTVGDAAFFAVLRTWAHDKRDGNGTTAEFVALAERISGRPLTSLFHQWLFTTTKPPLPAAPAGAAAPATSTRADAMHFAQAWRHGLQQRLAAHMR